MIGDRLRDLRKARGMTLRELGSATGLSPTLLSQIERGVTDPSLKSLRSIAEAFGQPVAALFDDGAVPPVHISRAGQRSRIVSPQGCIQYERLAPGNGQLEVLRGLLNPGESSSDRPSSHPSIECTYVVSGILTVTIGRARYEVAAGEAITIGPGQPHLYSNSAGTVEFVQAVTPPVR
jgi:transcriptional regulator with XRE-family HTH domain